MQKIPITLGIVGHIDAIITDEHKAKIKAIFTEIAKKYPNSPLVLFSQLARGVDTVVAELFLEVKEGAQKDYRLVVPIPYDLDAYKTSQFKTAEDLKRFEDLLSKAERYFVLNTLTEAEKNEGKSKGELYRKGAEFVANSSIVLIALWDMEYIGKTGGTSDIVFYKKHNAYKYKVSDAMFDDDGKLIEIQCNREKTVNKKEIILKDDYLQELLKGRELLKDENILTVALGKIEELNNLEYKDKTIDYEGKNTYTKLLEDYRYRAKKPARDDHEKYDKSIKVLFALSFLLILFLGIYQSFNMPSAFYLIVFFAVLIFAVLYFYHKKQYHKKYLDSRILAEALRVQIYWHMRGIEDSIANHTIRAHKSNCDWAKSILDALYGYTIPGEGHCGAKDDFVVERWANEQIGFFDRKIREFRKKFNTLNLVFESLLGASIAIMGVVFFLETQEIFDFKYWEVVRYINSLLFILAIFIKAFIHKMEYGNILLEYRLMFDIFNKAKKKIVEIKDCESNTNEEREKEINNLFKKLGKEAITENTRWYMVYKDKKPEIEGF